jgi:hypothetical protein
MNRERYPKKSNVDIELVPGRAKYLHTGKVPDGYCEPLTKVSDIHSIADYLNFAKDRLDALSYLRGKLLNISMDIKLGEALGNWEPVICKLQMLKSKAESIGAFWKNMDKLESMTYERIKAVLSSVHEEMQWRMQDLGVDFETAFKGYNIGIGGKLEKDANEFRRYLDDEIAIIRDAKERCTVDRVCPGMLWKLRGKLRDFLLKLADAI